MVDGWVEGAPGLVVEEPEARDQQWQALVSERLGDPGVPFEEHRVLFQHVYGARRPGAPPPRVYWPAAEALLGSNLSRSMRGRCSRYRDYHRWTVEHRAAFWRDTLERLGVRFTRAPDAILDLSEGVEAARWLPGAELSCVDTCFKADPSRVALLTGSEERPGELSSLTYGELEALANRVANGLRAHGFREGEALGLYLPMTAECVAAYLGVVRAGCVAVSIADSFAPPEVRARLRISGAKGLLTVDAFTRGGKRVGLYEKVKQAGAPTAIVIPGRGPPPALREGDLTWDALLSDDTRFTSVTGDPSRVANILFSSGTTGDPKAIPWTHLTPLKCAMDGHYHQDLHPEDVVAWPTSIGWMMGPWLLFAALYNEATLALFEGAPTGEGFVRFVEDAGVTVLGVVPALVRAWRHAGVLEGRHWTKVRVFSNTGEASNVEDSLWLMSRAAYRAPIIEYCGGTELGGGHLTGTVIQPASPATFTTPALGLDVAILDEQGRPVREGGLGELFVVPPSPGLSQRLLNADHHAVYYAGTPRGPRGETLRRHGDVVQPLPGGFYRAHGRADDTMNLGGIKVSSLELERVMDRHPDVYQTAAVAVQPEGGGADSLVVFAVPGRPGVDARRLAGELRALLGRELNPLFRVGDVVLVEALPRTASNKVLRRELRQRYLAGRRH